MVKTKSKTKKRSKLTKSKSTKTKSKKMLSEISTKVKDMDVVNKLEKIAEGLPDPLKKRLASAFILIPVVLFFIYASSNLFALLVLAAAIGITYEWQDIVKSSKDQGFWRLMGLLYVLVPTFSLIVIRNAENGADIILWLFMVVWATDTGAYSVGKSLQGPKIAPSISPKKTWSGLAGGVVASMLVGLVATIMFEESSIFFMSFSGVLAIIEQASDFLASKVKRTFGVKDSGCLIPGHGGILDRTDGYTLTAPLVMLFVLFSKHIF